MALWGSSRRLVLVSASVLVLLGCLGAVAAAVWADGEDFEECARASGNAPLAPLAVGVDEPVWAVPDRLPDGMQVEDLSDGQFGFSTPSVSLYGDEDAGDPLSAPRIAVIAATDVGYYRAPDGEAVTIDGTDGTVGSIDGAQVVAWNPRAGSLTVVAGWGVTGDDVVCVAKALERDAEGVRMPSEVLPAGMRPLARGDLVASSLVLDSRHPRHATRIRAIGPGDREVTIFASRGEPDLELLAQLFVGSDGRVLLSDSDSAGSVANVTRIDDVTVLVVGRNVDSGELDQIVSGLRLAAIPFS